MADHAAEVMDITLWRISGLAPAAIHWGPNWGVKKGDVVAIYLPNCPEFVITYFAAVKIGAIALPFNIIFKTGEISYLLNDSGAKVLIGASEEVKINVIKERKQFPGLEKIITVGDPLNHSLDFEYLLSQASEQLEPVECCGDDVMSLVYTSGTSGKPKGAMLTYCNLMTMATYNMRILHINDQDLVYAAPPFCHIALLITMFGPFCAGAGIVILNRFNAEKGLEVMSRYKATHVIGVPTMYIYMLKFFDSQKHDLTNLRLAFCAGGPMPMQYIEEIEHPPKNIGNSTRRQGRFNSLKIGLPRATTAKINMNMVTPP
jgi:long-chain acyl-CoA synthetase